MAIPALHVSLGIFNKLFKMLENACHQLDIKTAEAGYMPGNSSNEFTEYVTTLQTIRQYEEEISKLEDNARTAEEIALWIVMVVDEEASDQAVVLLKESNDFKKEANLLVSWSNVYYLIHKKISFDDDQIIYQYTYMRKYILYILNLEGKVKIITR